MVCDDVLRIKHLPKDFTDQDKENFLSYLGASQVKVVNLPEGKSIVFAKFDSAEVAKAVLIRLHQANVLNSRLCVEYADHDIGIKEPKIKRVESEDLTEKKYFKNFLLKLNSFNYSVGFQQPPPPHLKYDYPKANRATINNIAHALASIPKFYIQVLHLMNRMNLPPPFAIENPSVLAAPVNRNSPQVVQKTKSSSESELESDEETNKKTEYIPSKRLAPQTKAIKRPKFIKPNAKPVNTEPKIVTKSEDVFDKVDLHNRKIELNVSGDSLQKPAVEENLSNGNNLKETPVEPVIKTSSYISDEELSANQIPLKDLGVLPVFKDYHPGVPNTKIYVKNIAKNVKIEDLEFIYKRYKSDDSAEKSSEFNIRLMQEGRMKGQAFVTLDSVELAQKAVKETNGFILKDKPLVVVFARGPSNNKNS